MIICIYIYVLIYIYIYFYIYIIQNIYIICIIYIQYMFYIYIYIYIYQEQCNYFSKSYVFAFFLKSLKVWKKPKYNSWRDKCLDLDMYMYMYIEREGERQIQIQIYGYLWRDLGVFFIISFFISKRYSAFLIRISF